MRFKFYSICRKFVFILVLLAPIYSFSQLNISEAVIDTSKVDKPKAIPTINIIQKIEEAKSEIELANSKIPLDTNIIQIDSLYEIYVPFIKNQKTVVEKFIEAGPNKQKIDNLIKKWSVQYENLEVWESAINSYEEENLRLIEQISYNEQIWNLTYENAVLEKIPSEVLGRTKNVLSEIKKVKRSLNNKYNDLLRFESKINNQKIIIKKVVEDLMDLKNSEVYDLLYLRHQPLWKTSFKASESFNAIKNEIDSLSKNISIIFKLFKTSESLIYLYLITTGLIILLILFVKRSFIKNEFNDKDIDLQNAKDLILNHTLPIIIFLSLIISKLFFTNTPTLFNDFLILVLLITSIPLLNSYILKRFNKIIYFVILFYILDASKTYFWISPPIYRIYLLIEGILVVAILIYFTHPYLKTRKMQIGKFGLLLIRMTPVIYTLVFISILSNILGYTNLTDITLRISTQSGIITIIFYSMLMIAGGISTGVIHYQFSNLKSYDPVKKLTIEKKLLQVIRVIAFVYWFFFFLQMIDLLNPMTEFFTSLFSETHKMGTITFTIGSILTFIVILTISFLITSFISFIFGGGGISLKYFKLPKGVPSAISLVIRYFIIAFGFVLAFSSLGIDLSEFNLMAGALGLGIGFGLQTVISNFVSGLILVFERPILPGDVVEVNNLLGTVNRIGVRSSNIRTFEGSEVVVPNNNLISNDLINWTHSDKIKRVEILIGTTYDSDPNEILKILLGVAKENKDTLKSPPPMALFREFGESSLNFQLRFWVDFEVALEVKSDMSIGIYNRFKKLGVEIPFPQQDIYIKETPKQIQKGTISTKEE